MAADEGRQKDGATKMQRKGAQKKMKPNRKMPGKFRKFSPGDRKLPYKKMKRKL